MANVFDTRQLEQSLLHLLVSEKMVARVYMNRAHEEMFVTAPRRFIYNRAKRLFAETNGLLTDALFEFELKQSIPENEQSSYTAEWMVVAGMSVDESPDSLMDALERALLAQRVSEICKEAAGLLQDGSVEEAVSLVKSESVSLGMKSADIPHVEVVEYLHRKKLIEEKQANPKKFLGVKTGLPSFDFHTGGLFPAEVTLVSAVTGVGKSTLMKAIAANVITLEGKNVLHITNEESRLQVEMKYDALISDIAYSSFKKAEITPSEIQTWEDSLTELKKQSMYGRLFIKEIPQFDNCLAITRTYYELQQLGVPIHLLVIDYMDHLLPIEKSWSENDEQGKVAADVKGLAVSLNIPVLIATQAATSAEAKQEKGRSFGKLDVYGSKRKVHSCNTLIFVIQDSRDTSQLKPALGGTGVLESEYDCDWLWSLEAAKNRDGAPFFLKARQHVKTGRVTQIGGSGAGAPPRPGAGGKLSSPVRGAEETAAAAAEFDAMVGKSTDKAETTPDGASKPESIPEPPEQQKTASNPPKMARKK